MPVPMPKPEPETNPAAVAAVDHALMSVRYFLARRDFEEAEKYLAVATTQSAEAPEKKADVIRVRALTHYVKSFWQAVRDSAQTLLSGEQVTISGITVGVVEVNAESLTLRQAGQNITHYYADMKSGLALGLAKLLFRDGDPANELILGAFKTVNPSSDRAEARTHWQTAQRLGASEQVAELMPELDIQVPSDFDPEKPAMVASIPTPMPMPTPTPMPVTPESKFPVPPTTALNKLISDLKSSRNDEFAAARSSDEMVALANKLQGEANSMADDPTARLVLLATARDLAAGANDFSLAFLLVERMTDTHEVDTLQMRADVLAQAGRGAETPESTKQIAQQAMALSDEARLELRFNEALSILRNAQVVARKSRDNDLIQAVTDRLDETTEEKKLGG